MKIGILPYELRHEKNLAAIPLRSLTWPSQDADTGEPVGCIGDLNTHDHVVVYPSSTRLLRGFGGVSCKVDLLMAEPLAIQKRYYQSIWLLRHKFNAIFCRYGKYARRYTNVHQLAVVESWVDGREIDIPSVKPELCSIIASEKKDLLGHQMRHGVVTWAKQQGIAITVLGRGYAPFELKQDGLLNYRFSVIIENVQEQDYFTEKLLDCLLCGTMPIYWGAPNIGDYFETSGIFICHDLEQIQQTIAMLPSSLSSKQTAALANNRAQALLYGDLNGRIASLIFNKERP